MMALQISAGLIILLFLRLLSNCYTSGLSGVPGPYLARFSNIWRLVQTWKGHYERTAQDLHRRYGDVVRTGPNVVSLNDPEVIDRIYGVKADFPKSDFYKTMQRHHNGKVIPTLLTLTDKRTHAHLRKPVASIFATSTLTHFEPLIDRTIRELIVTLRQDFTDVSGTQKRCDIDHWLSYFAFDVMGEVSFSRSFGFLKNGHDIDNIIKSLSRRFKYCAVVGQMPWLDRLMWKNPLLSWFATKPDPFSVRAVDLFTDRMTKEKVHPSKAGGSGADIVSRILEVKRAHPDQVPDEAVVGYILTMLQAGPDSVSIMLCSIVYYLSKNRGFQSRLQKEMDDARLTYPASWGKVQGLVYLNAVIREAQRIHPPASIPLERIVPLSGLELPNGRTLKPGMIVSMNSWTINQNEKIFGQDAHTFNPDRWLKAEDEAEDQFRARTARMKRADITFGYGSRSCLGKPIAYMEIYKVVPTIFGLFDVRLADPKREWGYTSYFITKQHDMDVELRWRGVGECGIL